MSRFACSGSWLGPNLKTCFWSSMVVFLALLAALAWPGQGYCQGQKPVTVLSKTVSGNSAEIIITCGGDYKEPSFRVGIMDWHDNRTAQMSARPGEAFCAVLTDSGITIKQCGSAASSREIDVKNELLQGAITAELYLDHRLVVSIAGVATGQKARFSIKCQE